MNKIYETNYQKLTKIIDLPLLKKNGYLKYKAPSNAIMDLNSDFLRTERNGNYIIALSHYYIENGDAIADPDMELRINETYTPTIEALTFQNKYTYQKVYIKKGKGEGTLINLRLKREFNKFLETWLTNLAEYEYKLVVESEITK